MKTRPASAARPSLLYRTCKLILASLFQGAVSGMKDSYVIALQLLCFGRSILPMFIRRLKAKLFRSKVWLRV